MVKWSSSQWSSTTCRWCRRRRGGDDGCQVASASPLGIRIGSCYVPLHDHDAHFWDDEAGVFGVADGGVGKYMHLGVYSRAFSSRLTASAFAEAAAARPGMPLCPLALLETAHNRTIASCASRASTAVILSFNSRCRAQRWAYIGNSGFAVLRGGRIVYRSVPQQDFFGTPFQLSADPEVSSDVAMAQAGQIATRDGDVVVVGTDGLFDNIRDAHLELVAQIGTKLGFSAQNMADVIAGTAYEASRRTIGGKRDEITVVVAFSLQSDL